jgi:hypothetical protein
MSFPAFSSGDILTANDMNAVGMWRITNCGVSSAGGTAATASNGVITVGTSNTSVTVTSAFSSNYENYRVIISGVDFSTTGFLRLTFGAATTAYYSALRQMFVAALGDALQKVDNGAYLEIGTQGLTNDTFTVFDVSSPNLARRTQISGQFATATTDVGYFAGTLANTTAYTAFTITPAAGNMTGGTIRVYGYRD